MQEIVATDLSKTDLNSLSPNINDHFSNDVQSRAANQSNDTRLDDIVGNFWAAKRIKVNYSEDLVKLLAAPPDLEDNQKSLLEMLGIESESLPKNFKQFKRLHLEEVVPEDQEARKQNEITPYPVFDRVPNYIGILEGDPHVSVEFVSVHDQFEKVEFGLDLIAVLKQRDTMVLEAKITLKSIFQSKLGGVMRT